MAISLSKDFSFMTGNLTIRVHHSGIDHRGDQTLRDRVKTIQLLLEQIAVDSEEAMFREESIHTEPVVQSSTFPHPQGNEIF